MDGSNVEKDLKKIGKQERRLKGNKSTPDKDKVSEHGAD